MTFERARQQGIAAIYGDGSSASVLNAAGVSRARLLVIASPDSYQSRNILELARRANPQIQTIIRTHTEEDLELLQRKGVTLAVMGERELGRRMSEQALRCLGVPAAEANRIVE